MWKFVKKDKKETPDEKKARTFGVWYFLLISFIVIWMAGAYVYLSKKTEISISSPPIVVLDAANGIDMTNFFQVNPTNRQISVSNPVRPMFEIKQKYETGDVVVVKYFYVEAIVIKRSFSEDAYTIMYKNHEHTLETITLPRQLLMSPSDGVLNPVSMLVD